MTLFSAFRFYIGEIERRRLYRRTQAMLHALPPEMLKDIGWPGVAEGIEDACMPKAAGRR